MKIKHKIGFIVEGDDDKLIVETLGCRILPKSFELHTVRLGGKAGLYTAYTTVMLFLDNDYHHTVIVFDKDESEEWLLPMVEETLERYNLLEKTTICPAVPAIEAWLLAEYETNPEELANPTTALAAQLKLPDLGSEVIFELANRLNIEKARKRSESFNNFVCGLQAIAEAVSEEDKILAAV